MSQARYIATLVAYFADLKKARRQCARQGRIPTSTLSPDCYAFKYAFSTVFFLYRIALKRLLSCEIVSALRISFRISLAMNRLKFKQNMRPVQS